MIIPWSPSLSQKWDAYCDENALAWFWHRSGWMTYCASRASEMLNLSFAVVHDGEIVGICPIIREGSALLYEHEPCPEPLYDNDVIKAEMLTHLRSVMDSYGIDSYDFRGAMDGIPTSDVSWATRIIELHAPSEIESIHRWLNVRKSYKSLIHKFQGTHRLDKSHDPRMVNILHDLHREQAGRETRSQTTWDLMAAWVQSGHAYLCTAFNSAGICDGAIYVYAYKDHEYYGHAATRIKDINHALIWKAISTSTAQTFETGWQGHARDEKGQAIEFFRRGFGGTNEPFIVSRFYA
jgi:hypothetical protein